MSGQLDSILERSRTPGSFVERRRFTLSRDKAVEKLREFSLRHPEQYILELVQAAVFAGARWIAIDISKERLFFAWVGGKPYTAEQLEHVFDFLFADRSARETRHVVQLAVSLNALLQRNPRVVRVESGDGTQEGTVRMDLDKGGKGHLGRPEESFQGTYLVVEHATSWFARFDTTDWTREQGLVEERCLYSPVPILLNYRAPFGYRANRQIKLYGVPLSQAFDGEGRRGVLGAPDINAKDDEGVRIVIGGVWVTTRRIPELGRVPGRGGEPRHIVGVICDDGLRKTADQGDIVEDGRFIDMLHHLQPVATTLIQRAGAGSSYKPPALPRRVHEAPVGPTAVRSTGPAPEPLPEPVAQVAPRPELEVELLAGLPAGTPVFWVDPETARSLGVGADPDRFPFRLLILTPGQAVTLSTVVPHLSLGAVTSAADAEFVTRVFSRQAETHQVTLPFGPDAGLEGRGRLVLRLHIRGARPAWGVEGPDDVPVAVRVARRATWCGSLHLGLPDVSVTVELDGGSFDELDGPVAISHLLRRSAWRLLVDLVDPDQATLQPRPVRALAVALLAMSAAANLYAVDDGDETVAMAVTLPRTWAELAGRLRRLPLCQAEQGPLTFDGFVDLLTARQDTPATATLLAQDDLDLLDPIEQRLGYGHLLLAGGDGRPLLAVALVGGGLQARWTAWRPDQEVPGPKVQAVLWLADDLQPRLHMAGWRLVDRPVPGIGLAEREDRAGGEIADLRAGLRLLYEDIARAVREDLWEEVLGLADDPEAASAAGVDRARQLGRLALVGLAAYTDHRAGRVLPASDGVGWRRLDELEPTEEGGSLVRVAARHGPRVVERDTVLLSWDEVRTLDRAGVPVPLRFDDPPELWDSLVSPPPAASAEGAEPGWLLRERLQIPGIDGWLGLRWPYDPTSAVLVQQSGELVALSHVDRHVPCHGLAWTQGATDGVGRIQRDLLELARLRLYQRLAERMSAEADPHWREVAACYATDFAVHAWRSRQGEDLGGTAARLLVALRLADDEGRSLGSLDAWLSLSPDRRPVPVGHVARYLGVRQLEAQATRDEGDYQASLTALERRLGRVLALASKSPDLRAFLFAWEGGRDEPAVRIRDEGSSHGLVSLELNEHHPLVYSALAEPGEAREILLLEAARLGTRVVRESGGQLDLLHVHQLLAAQRI